MKVRIVNLGKYKMCIGWKYKLKHLFSFDRYWSGQIWHFMFICTYGIEFDFRTGNIIDKLLTTREKEQFYINWFSERN